ncbi:MAG: YegS/Rv2252/BmrU family lipid kinase [bacterium]|nr:YegS/Rv2252/BmrU family lipid kinase [bacterium]
MLSIKLIINPNAGSVRNNFLFLNKLIRKLSQNSILTEVIYTSADKSERNMILEKLETCDAFIVFGGDGTINRVVTYLINAGIRKPILVIPGGTANVFALEKKLTTKIDKIIELLKGRKSVATDIGFVEHKSGINYFLLMVGIGLDAQAINEVDGNIKKLFGKATYLFSGVKNFMTYKPKQILVETATKTIKDIYTVVISNSRLYGGNIELFPEADMHDGLLDMCAFHPKNSLEFLKTLADIQSGKHRNSSDVYFNKIETADISPVHDNIPFHIDGESIGFLPITVGVLKGKVDFILEGK